MSRTTVAGSVLIVAALLIAFGILTRGWLEADLDDLDRQTIGRNVGTVSLGLNGATLCEPAGGPCHGEWYYGGHLREDISLRVGGCLSKRAPPTRTWALSSLGTRWTGNPGSTDREPGGTDRHSRSSPLIAAATWGRARTGPKAGVPITARERNRPPTGGGA